MKEQRFNLAHRLIHWAIAFTVLFILLTILLRMEWMNKDQIGDIIQQNLSKSGHPISAKEAAAIGKEVRRPMWNYHPLAGYTLIGLYLIRMAITATQGIAYKGPFSKSATSGEKFQAWMYIIFYILLTISLFTGFMLVNGPKNLHSAMASIHTKSLYYVVVFIILHVGGVLIADAGPQKGLISKIISGDKTGSTPG